MIGLQDRKSLPKARTAKDWKQSLIWIVPLIAAGFVGWLAYWTFIQRGPTITILFEHAKDLEAEKSDVKYRGAKIGNVKSIKLSEDHKHVVVKASLEAAAADLAREGSQFWIVKAEVAVGRVSELRTIVSGDYIALKPGHGKRAKEFNGLEEPPVTKTVEQGLKIVLLADKLGSVERASPVYYRGLKVGEVLDYELAADSQAVRITAFVEQDFAPLVRMNSKFWNAGGIKVDLSLLGAAIQAQSLKSIIAGGLAFASPDDPEEPAKNGTAFRLYDKPEDKWLGWAPKIPLRAQELSSHDAQK